MTASGQNLIKPCWTFFSKVPKIFFSHFPTHSPAVQSQPFPAADQDLSECDLANLPKDTPPVKKCALSFRLPIVLIGNLSHGLSNKCIECNECCNVYRMSYMIVVHTTMKRQTKTKKGRASLNALDDLIKNKNLINELTSSRVLKKSYKYAYTHAHIIYKT